MFTCSDTGISLNLPHLIESAALDLRNLGELVDELHELPVRRIRAETLIHFAPEADELPAALKHRRLIDHLHPDEKIAVLTEIDAHLEMRILSELLNRFVRNAKSAASRTCFEQFHGHKIHTLEDAEDLNEFTQQKALGFAAIIGCFLHAAINETHNL